MNNLHTNIRALYKHYLQSRLRCTVWLHPIDDADLFSSSFSSVPLPLPFHTVTTKIYQKIPMMFLSTPFLTFGFFCGNCGDRAQGKMSIFSMARCQTETLGDGLQRRTRELQWGWLLARDGARLTRLCLYINHDRARNPLRQSQRIVSSLWRLKKELEAVR